MTKEQIEQEKDFLINEILKYRDTDHFKANLRRLIDDFLNSPAAQSYWQGREWVNRYDRLPTTDDADKEGYVLGWDRIKGLSHKCLFNDVVEMKIRFSHWQPLPSPPKTEQ
jgi:hypothetical protein